MLKKPRLKYSYSAEFLGDEKTLLISEKDNILLYGRLYSKVLLEVQQNSMPVDKLITKLEDRFSPFEICHALDVLEKKGFLTEDSPALPQETNAYWNSQGIAVNTLFELLQEKAICVETIGSLAPDVFSQAFSAIRIRTQAAGVLKVVITDDYQRQKLRQINREAIETKQPWMLVKPVGVEVWLGPIFLPGKTACWECLQQRLEINRPLDTLYKAQKKSEEHLQAPTAHIPLSLQIAANQAAIEIVKWLYFEKNESLEGKVVTFDSQSLTGRSHVLVKRPQCKTCGEPGYGNPDHNTIVLKRTAPVSVTSAGGYREIAPEETIAKYRHHVSPITGVAPELKPYYKIKGTPLFNYYSGRNFALRSKTLFWLNQHVRSGNGGKGRTRPQAKVGALCEAIERYSIMYHGDEPCITGSLEGLGKDGIHPNACMNFSEKQYQKREEHNRTCSEFYALVPVTFYESLQMDWTPVYSLTEKRFKYLPTCYCYAQYPAENELKLFSYPDSNGCAAGNSIEEAILQGFLELVERDSIALWWYNRLRKPGVDLLSFNDPYFLQLIEYYKSLNRSLYVLDITADMQIPAFAAVSHRLDDNNQNIIFGFGAHVDAGIAVERALVELNQILPLVTVPESDRVQGKYRVKDKNFVDWLNKTTLENQPYLVPLENKPAKKASGYPPLCKPNIYDSLVFCLHRAAECGLETLVLDMTRPDIGLNVVKVIVPGLRHFWKRLAPGRLYEVPVKMGWQKAPLKEEELNPVGLFI